MHSVSEVREIDRGEKRRWLALGATCFGLFMSLLDVTIVNVAIPVIGTSLKASLSNLQWIVDGYALSLAVLLITGGRLGDLFGRKRFFLIGLATFSIGSLMCALSGSLPGLPIQPMAMLIGARIIQGAGAAIMLPLALAIIASTFRGRERGVAYGIYGGVAALGVAIGPVIGGVLVQRVGWSSIFYLNVPIGTVAIALCVWAMAESRDDSAGRQVDIPGLAFLTVGLTALFLALIQGNDRGWGSSYILLLFVAAALLLASFAAVELQQKSPMVDFRIFRSRGFAVSCIVGFTLNTGLYALLFFIGLYLQNFLGFSALDAGLRMLTLSAPILIFAPLAGVLGSRIGPQLVVSIGMAVLTVSVALLLRLPTGSAGTAWVFLIPAFVGSGIASGLINPSMSSLAIDSVQSEKSGMAAGVNNAFQQLGISFGIAFLGALLQIKYAHGLSAGIAAIAARDASSVSGVTLSQQLVTISRRLSAAGTFIGSTGLRNPPQALTWISQLPFFPSIQSAVQTAFLDGLRRVFAVAIVVAALGLICALTLVFKKKTFPS